MPPGQSPIGDSFIIGRGLANAASGDWPAVCGVMMAPLPPLRSCLVDVCGLDAAGGGASSMPLAQREKKQLQYQQMMLGESVTTAVSIYDVW